MKARHIPSFVLHQLVTRGSVTVGLSLVTALSTLTPFSSMGAPSAGDNLVANSSFEHDETFYRISPVPPTVFADWQGDWSESVYANSGITPYLGSRMLQFMYTLPSGPNGVSSQGDMWQLIDASPFAELIAGGSAVATASVQYNRVPGTMQTDTEFRLYLSAHAGLPGDFPGQTDSGWLASQRTTLLSDSDPTTWETLTAVLALPPQTDYLAIRLAAVENIDNNGSSLEFHGHFADDVFAAVIPEPSSAVLLGGGMFLLLVMRIRRWFGRR
jgi:hypothetical protein